MKTGVIHFVRRIRNTRFGNILRRIYQTPLGNFIFGRFFKKHFGISAVTGIPLRQAKNRGPAPVIEQEELRRRYQAAPVSEKDDTFVLYRIIGNDLVPRHRKGQSRENLSFILANEPNLTGCEKRFVLNRIVDSEEEAAIIQLLEKHGRPYLRIPFSDKEYTQQPWDLEGLPEPGYTLSRQYDELPEDFRARLYKRLYRHKNNYLINNNGARNTALADGRDRAKWVLPWDGNCFLTTEAWQEIRSAVETQPWYPYIIVPMARLTDHAVLFEPGFRPEADQEPQIMFRSDASHTFDEDYYYGRRPKVELLWRLGVPGPWDEWAIEPWDLPYPEYGQDAGAWQKAGWVARLPSGSPRLEKGMGSETMRLGVRSEAVTVFLQRMDAEGICRKLSVSPLFFLKNEKNLEHKKESEKEAYRRLPSIWNDISLITSRRTRKETPKACRKAETFLLSYKETPVLLDQISIDAHRKEAEQLLEWLQVDAGARCIRRKFTAAGSLHSVFTAVLAAKLKRYGLLSRTILLASDRAAALFGNGTAVLEKDETQLFCWKALEWIAKACGENLWVGVSRPRQLDWQIDIMSLLKRNKLGEA